MIYGWEIRKWAGRLALWGTLGLSLAALAWPAFAPRVEGLQPGLPLGGESSGLRLPLGTDRRGVPFILSLTSAMWESGRVALAGTAGVLAGALFLGAAEASLRSRPGKLALQVLTLGAMAIPDVALLMTVASALPRGTRPLVFDLVILGIVGALWVPPTSRLVASRIRALRTSLFVRASRSLGAGPWYLFRKEIAPHLAEDVAWLFASVFPRFLHVELGLAYIGLEYHFNGLGLLLQTTFGQVGQRDPYLTHLAAASLAAIWLSLLPMLVLHALGIRTLPHP